MQRAAILCLATALCAVPVALSAPLQAAAQTKAVAFKVPHNAYGQPDLSGYWSNATLTPEARPMSLGDRATYTPAEVAKMENAVVEEVKEGNAPTDPNAPAAAPPNPKNLRPEFAAAGGDVGGYNRGWLDPGSTVMRVHGEPRTSFITTSNGQAPARKANAAPQPGFGGGRGGLGSFDNPESRSLGERCIMGFGRNAGPPMLPNGFYNNNYQIVQSKDAVVIEVEMVHDLRIIPLKAAHRADGVRPWMGDSIGHYEGDTLVVETTNIPQAQAYRGAWKNLKVTERFTRVAKDHVLYQYTIDDPTVWEKPWGGEYEFAPLHGVIYEYACHEGNYALPGMLGGARAQEKEAAAAKTSAPAGGR